MRETANTIIKVIGSNSFFFTTRRIRRSELDGMRRGEFCGCDCDLRFWMVGISFDFVVVGVS